MSADKATKHDKSSLEPLNSTYFRAVVESAPACIAVLDLECRYQFINRQGATFFGLKVDEIVGGTLWDFFPKDYADHRAVTVRRAIEDGQHYDEEVTVPLGGRQWDFLIRIEPIRDADGKCRTAVVVVYDITHRKVMEEALRMSEAKYRAIVDAATEMITRFLPDTTLTYVNDVSRRFFGWKSDEMIGKSFLPQLQPEVRQKLQAALDSLTPANPVTQIEHTVVRCDGEARWFSWANHGLFDRKGRLVEVQGVGRDITEQKLAKEWLQAARRQIDQTCETERKRLARDLHDSVGQSLVALQLGVRRLLKETDDFSKAKIVKLRRSQSRRSYRPTAPGLRMHRTFAGVLGRLSEQCDGLIRKVRNISRGLYPATLESLGLVSAIRQVINEFHVSGKVASGPRLEVRCTVRAASARFPAEVEIALFRATQEAIVNAVRHACAKRIEVNLDYAAGEATVEVCDDGTGFDPSQRSTAGLGLTTMLERVQSVGGRVEIDSGPTGTRVLARVPTKLLHKRAGRQTRRAGLRRLQDCTDLEEERGNEQ